VLQGGGWSYLWSLCGGDVRVNVAYLWCANMFDSCCCMALVWTVVPEDMAGSQNRAPRCYYMSFIAGVPVLDARGRNRFFCVAARCSAKEKCSRTTRPAVYDAGQLDATRTIAMQSVVSLCR